MGVAKMTSHTLKLRESSAEVTSEVSIYEQQDGFMQRKRTANAIFDFGMLIEYRDDQRATLCLCTSRNSLTGNKERS